MFRQGVVSDVGLSVSCNVLNPGVHLREFISRPTPGWWLGHLAERRTEVKLLMFKELNPEAF